MKNVKITRKKIQVILFILLTLSLSIGLFFSLVPHENKVEIKPILAYISGAINKPGVYSLNEGTRVIELISYAEGYTNEVDSNFVSQQMNLAEKVKDEQKIYIPSITPVVATASNTISNGSKINLNTATIDELETLPGIGAAYAQRIIDNRPYSKVEDLLNVNGIGDAKYSKLKDLVIVE